MVEYKDTLNLPKTAFDMRASLAVKEPPMVDAWQKRDLYGEIQHARADCPTFILHDGPPYANGTLHHGHILNKILKDIVIKDRSMAGFRAPYIPGWDCHGLPIEVQVDKELGRRKADMSRADIQAACRAYAQRFVDIQRDAFIRLGILGRWHNPYLTMNFAYEAATLRELATLVRRGLVYKGLRPVNWCIVHQTALAEAEVEYEQHRSPSAYVAFRRVRHGDATVEPHNLPDEFDFVIWTTTPWTLPANRAIALHPDFTYIAYPIRGRYRLFAMELAEKFLEAIGEPKFDAGKVLGRWQGRELEGLHYQHALLPAHYPIILADHVTQDAGTGCVHTAPGHGAEDFEVARRYGLDVVSTADGQGKLTDLAGQFAGLDVFAANPQILALLRDRQVLLSSVEQSVDHRYPTCWRCHKPIILRATEQWFVAMDKPFAEGTSLRARALEALDQVTWFPRWGQDRIRGMLATRPDWCLSRQRIWGVPLAILYCEKCHKAKIDPDIMDHVADIFAQQGASAWFNLSTQELCGPQVCEACNGTVFRKEHDILDVWFDSGTSFAAVIEREHVGHQEGIPIDLYLEGSDQHRGWFHSSLLCSLATRLQPPYRAVLTHGFVVDGAGKKISKSKGNYIDPFKAIEKDGAEILRLWVACENYTEDVRLSNEILTRLADSYRKVRNTVRYLLGNVHDFDPQHDVVNAEAMLEIDRYGLALMHQATTQVRQAYEKYNFHTAMQLIIELCTVDLSAFYLDILKDRLYASKATSSARRSAQTALYVIARDLLCLLAPVLCFTSQEAWSHLPKTTKDPDNIHLMLYPGHKLQHDSGQFLAIRAAIAAESETLMAHYAALRDMRRAVNAVLEETRRQKKIGSSVEAAVTLHLPKDMDSRLQSWSDDTLASAFIVSAVVRCRDALEMRIDVSKAGGSKCSRCWLYRTEVGSFPQHPALCRRCMEAL